MAMRTASPERRDDPVASGTVVATPPDPTRPRAYAVGVLSRAVAAALLFIGVATVTLALLSPLTTAPWVLVGVTALLAGALATLSIGTGATGWWPRLWAALGRAASPYPVPARGAAQMGRIAQARTFDLLAVDGTRVTCEVLGPLRRRSPQSGQIADVYGTRRSDGTVRVRRVVYALDGAVFRPRADFGFAAVRFATGVGTVLGPLLTLVSVAVMTVRSP